VIEFLLSIFFPKRCVNCKRFGKYICDECFTRISFASFSKCIVCMKPSISGLTHNRCLKRYSVDGMFAALEYKSVVKKAIYNYKYEPYIYKLSEIFTRLMYESFIQNEVLMSSLTASDNVWITCVPLHRKRLNKRGYNQSVLLGKKIALKFGLPFSSRLLSRIRDTKPQFKLKKKERAQNILGAFELNPKLAGKTKGKTVFLVDDVFTSGATIRECGKVLKKSGAKKVYGLALAMEQ